MHGPAQTFSAAAALASEPTLRSLRPRERCSYKLIRKMASPPGISRFPQQLGGEPVRARPLELGAPRTHALRCQRLLIAPPAEVRGAG
eukprot:8601139-Pyramimonas_sp.AAC.1